MSARQCWNRNRKKAVTHGKDGSHFGSATRFLACDYSNSRMVRSMTCEYSHQRCCPEEALFASCECLQVFHRPVVVTLFSSSALYADSSRFSMITGGYSAYGLTDLLPKHDGAGKFAPSQPSGAFLGVGSFHNGAAGDMWSSNGIKRSERVPDSGQNFSHFNSGSFWEHRYTPIFSNGSGRAHHGGSTSTDIPTSIPEPNSGLLLVLGLGAAAVGVFALAKK